MNISFNNFDKDDYVSVMRAFDKEFMEVPFTDSKRFRTVKKFVPFNIRVEKVLQKENLLGSTLLSALIAQCGEICDYFLDGLKNMFKECGIEEYMESAEGKDYSAERYLFEISGIIYDRNIGIMPHTVLKLYGIECPQELAEGFGSLIEKINASTVKRIEEALNEFAKESESSAAGELKKEKESNEKLKKSLDKAEARVKELEKNEKQIREENKLLKGTVETQGAKISELEGEVAVAQKELEKKRSAIDSQIKEIGGLRYELGNARDSLQMLQDKYDALSLEAANKFSLSDEEIKDIAVSAIAHLSTKEHSKSDILEMAKRRFSENDDPKTAWRMLCDDSFNIVSELYTRLTCGGFDFSCFDRFTELESLLLLESAIKQSLYAVAHKILSSADETEPLRGNFTVQD